MPFRPAILRKRLSGAETKAPLAVLAASTMLVIGVGGGSFAAGLITGADIKNGTVTSADIENGSLIANDLAPGVPTSLAPKVYSTSKVAGTMLTDTYQKIVSLKVPAGSYVVTATGTVFEDQDAPAMGECIIKASRGGAVNNLVSTATIPAGGLYATVAPQAVFASAGGEFRLRCAGTNAGVNFVSMTATRVGELHTS